MGTLLEWITRYKDALPILGGCVAALATAGWAVYKFLYDKRKAQLPPPLGPGSSVTTAPAGESVPIANLEAYLAQREAAIRAQIEAEYAAKHDSRDSALAGVMRAIGGMAVGFVLAPFVFFKGGCALPIALAVAFSIVAVLFDSSVRTAAAIGAWLGLVAWFSGFSAFMSIGAARGDGEASTVRDALVGVTSGAIVGSVLLLVLSHTAKAAPSPALATASVGAAIGAVAGIIAAQVADEWS